MIRPPYLPLLLLLGLALSGPPSSAADQSPATVPVGLVWDERYKLHDAGAGHPERPERLDAILAALQQAGLEAKLTRIAPRSIEDQWLNLVHPAEYVKLVENAVAQGKTSLPTGDTSISAKTYETARLAAGGVLAACDAVMAGTVRRAFCAVRPPGHHASASKGMGFCVFNNVAIAARYLMAKHGLKRVLIVDWDVHHGNGTYEVFIADPSVFQFHLQQRQLYPGTGDASEWGTGAGEGFTINNPVEAGTGDDQIIALFTKRLPPAMVEFKPEFVLISCGFDSHAGDPLGGLKLSDAGFAALTRIVVGVAERYAQGRVVSVLEGGYDLGNLGTGAVAHLGALMEPAVAPAAAPAPTPR
jgi:acetoin utilization deacetylase AcuC-like enzyme